MEINYINGKKTNLVDLDNNELQSINSSTLTTPSIQSTTNSTITSTTTINPTTPNFNISTTPIVSTTTTFPFTTTSFPSTTTSIPPININKKFVQINNSAYWNQDTIYKVNNNKSMAFVTYNDANVIYLMGKYYGGNIFEENLGNVHFTYSSYHNLELKLMSYNTPGFYKFRSYDYGYSSGILKVVKTDLCIYKEVNVSLKKDQKTLYKMLGYAFDNDWFWEIKEIRK